MDSLPKNIYFKDIEGRYIRVNRAKARRSGLRDPRGGRWQERPGFLSRRARAAPWKMNGR